MSSAMIVILSLAVIALVIGIALASRGGGPRVTKIDRTIQREKDGDDA